MECDSLCVTAKQRERGKTRKEEGHFERKPLEGDTLNVIVTIADVSKGTTFIYMFTAASTAT